VHSNVIFPYSTSSNLILIEQLQEETGFRVYEEIERKGENWNSNRIFIDNNESNELYN